VRLDAWVAPSHTQAARVADDGLDLAICWVRGQDLRERGLHARPVGADRLHAVTTGQGDDGTPVHVRDTVVLLDDDTTSWSSWNEYAEELARDTGALTLRISDGGITGPAFFDHVRRSGRPVVRSPKEMAAPLPTDLARRPLVDPAVCWTWSLVRRAGETRPAVLAVEAALCAGVGELGLDRPGAWLPADDPHRAR
jgi:hypothetical protein